MLKQSFMKYVAQELLPKNIWFYKEQVIEMNSWIQPRDLIEIHLVVVTGPPTKKFLPKCINEKSSTERRIRPTDLLNNVKSWVNTD